MAVTNGVNGNGHEQTNTVLITGAGGWLGGIVSGYVSVDSSLRHAEMGRGCTETRAAASTASLPSSRVHTLWKAGARQARE
jgi:hydroxyethylthiazole kinase-like sugar kinase family protein